MYFQRNDGVRKLSKALAIQCEQFGVRQTNDKDENV